jgi:hypothetical protein
MRAPTNALVPVVNALQVAFLTFLPRIRLHGEVYFRHVRCRVQREDCIAEMIALAWKWHCRLAQRGKDARRFVTAIATFAARAVNSGRRLAGIERPQDVLSRRAQREHGFVVASLPPTPHVSHEYLYAMPRGQHMQDVYEERLQDNTQTPVPEQAAFRIDWPAWLTTITERDRRLVMDLALNHRTKDLARQYGLSPARISQKRREFHDDWEQFTADPGAADPSIVG